MRVNHGKEARRRRDLAPRRQMFYTSVILADKSAPNLLEKQKTLSVPLLTQYHLHLLPVRQVARKVSQHTYIPLNTPLALPQTR